MSAPLRERLCKVDVLLVNRSQGVRRETEAGVRLVNGHRMIFPPHLAEPRPIQCHDDLCPQLTGTVPYFMSLSTIHPSIRG
jgi:hypothetical protein